MEMWFFNKIEGGKEMTRTFKEMEIGGRKPMSFLMLAQ